MCLWAHVAKPIVFLPAQWLWHVWEASLRYLNSWSTVLYFTLKPPKIEREHVFEQFNPKKNYGGIPGAHAIKWCDIMTCIFEMKPDNWNNAIQTTLGKFPRFFSSNFNAPSKYITWSMWTAKLGNMVANSSQPMDFAARIKFPRHHLTFISSPRPNLDVQ